MTLGCPRHSFLCLSGLYTHGVRAVSINDHRKPHISSGLIPVRRCTRTMSAVFGMRNGSVASTTESGTGMTGGVSLAADLPRFRFGTCVSSAFTTAGIMASSNAHAIIRFTVPTLLFTVYRHSPERTRASRCRSMSRWVSSAMVALPYISRKRLTSTDALFASLVGVPSAWR